MKLPQTVKDILQSSLDEYRDCPHRDAEPIEAELQSFLANFDDSGNEIKKPPFATGDAFTTKEPEKAAFTKGELLWQKTTTAAVKAERELHSLYERAINSGWQIDEIGCVHLPGDVSEEWCAEWSVVPRVMRNGKSVSIPHFLERRLNEKEEVKKTYNATSVDHGTRCINVLESEVEHCKRLLEHHDALISNMSKRVQAFSEAIEMKLDAHIEQTMSDMQKLNAYIEDLHGRVNRNVATERQLLDQLELQVDELTKGWNGGDDQIEGIHKRISLSNADNNGRFTAASDAIHEHSKQLQRHNDVLTALCKQPETASDSEITVDWLKSIGFTALSSWEWMEYGRMLLAFNCVTNRWQWSRDSLLILKTRRDVLDLCRLMGVEVKQ